MGGSVFDSEAFTSSCFFPRVELSPPPAHADDLQIAVPGASLHLRRHRLRERAPTVLLFHGNAEVVGDYDEAADRFAQQGLNLAVCDFRGYGASTGTPSLRTMLADAPLVLEAVGASGPLIVMGRSLGSACALELYARPGLAGVILESGFIDLNQLVARRRLPSPRRYTEEELATFDPRRKLARGNGPLLVIHGAQDRSISSDEAKEVFELATTPHKHLALIEGRGHNDVSYAPAYWEALAHVWTWPALRVLERK
jgi:hypothetical protein